MVLTLPPSRDVQASRWHTPRRLVVVLLVVTLLCLVAIGASRTVRLSAVHESPSALPRASSASPPWAPPADPLPWAPRRGQHSRVPRAGWPPQSSATPSSTSLDLTALADLVDPALVDINTQLGTPNAQAAGTGIVLDPSGVVLTNNHVISGATSITATDIGTRQTYPATVVGYDRTHDVAVLQLEGASGLPSAQIGDAGTLAVGDAIAGIGNAGGRGGTPAIAAGVVTALHQSVTVRDDGTGATEQLTDLIQAAADIQPGDSGGPLVTSAGQVVGMVTAGSAGSWTRSGAATGEGLAIPINNAIAISTQIRSGSGSPTIHLGPTGILGITVQAGNPPTGPAQLGRFRGRRHAATPGAVITGTMPGSPAEQAGLAAGDTIVSLDAASVDSPGTLTTLLSTHHPGDSVQLAWLDPAGQQHTATIQLTAGPPS